MGSNGALVLMVVSIVVVVGSGTQFVLPSVVCSHFIAKSFMASVVILRCFIGNFCSSARFGACVPLLNLGLFS